MKIRDRLRRKYWVRVVTEAGGERQKVGTIRTVIKVVWNMYSVDKMEVELYDRNDRKHN